MNETFYTVSDLSRFSGLSRTRINQMISEGKLKADKHPIKKRQWEIKKEDWDQYCQLNRTPQWIQKETKEETQGGTSGH